MKSKGVKDNLTTVKAPAVTDLVPSWEDYFIFSVLYIVKDKYKTKTSLPCSALKCFCRSGCPNCGVW